MQKTIKSKRIANYLKGLSGQILIFCMPELAGKVANESFSLNMRKGPHVLKHLIRVALGQRAIRENALDKIANYHKGFWSGSNAVNFYEATRDRFQNIFLVYYVDVIDELEKQLDAIGNFKTFIEIGTGSGQVLKYLHDRFTYIEKFIGIDLCAEQIMRNQVVYSPTRMHFISGDAITWIKSNGESHSVFITSHGVLEYFTQNQLYELLETIQNSSIFILIEPIAADYDMSKVTTSMPFGNEFSFSHNYPFLLSKAGFKIHYQKEIDVATNRMLAIVASN